MFFHLRCWVWHFGKLKLVMDLPKMWDLQLFWLFLQWIPHTGKYLCCLIFIEFRDRLWSAKIKICEIYSNSVGYESNQDKSTIVLTEFLLCSFVIVGLGELDVMYNVGSSLLPHCRCDDNKSVVISFVCLIIKLKISVVVSFVCLIINTFSMPLSEMRCEIINSIPQTQCKQQLNTTSSHAAAN